MTQALLSFSLGPVQEFIAAARTTRDLWTGSYLLSWLTAHAIVAIEQHAGGTDNLIFPDVTGNPLVRAVRDGEAAKVSDEGRLPCLPNTFLAKLPDTSEEDAREIAAHCRHAVAEAWLQICKDVREQIEQLPPWNADPDALWRWEEQCADYWDVRLTVLPGDRPDEGVLRRLLAFDGSADAFVLREELLARLPRADKNVRPYPPHEPESDSHRESRPKCSLFGSYAQMGPRASLKELREFWEQANKQTELYGTRLGKRDRMCPIGLVKRFAWAAYFRQRTASPDGGHRDFRIGRRYPDIDAVCAAEWLARANHEVGLDREQTHTHGPPRRSYWSGHWLRWADQFDGRDPGLDDPEPCPDEDTWKRIKAAKTRLGAPPAYYAVLMLDGDGMGNRVRRSNEPQLRHLSATLAGFSLRNVRGIVESDKHYGTLVYAGGDDVLAVLPARTALGGALELASKFNALPLPFADQFGPASLSGAVVIAHSKPSWRDVLETARASERQAKQARRADSQQREIPGWLALTVQRRSGEHSTVCVSWDRVHQTITLVDDFAAGTTDRWAYRLRQQLGFLPDDAGPRNAELRRLLDKAEGLSNSKRDVKSVRSHIGQLWRDMRAAESIEEATDFTHLVQSASFLARGGKE